MSDPLGNIDSNGLWNYVAGDPINLRDPWGLAATERGVHTGLDFDPPDAPLGCLAQPSGRWIRLWAAAASADGRRLVRSDLTGPLDEPEGLGAAVSPYPGAASRWHRHCTSTGRDDD